MENVEFDFEKYEYLYFIKLNEMKVSMGIIEMDKMEDKSDNEKELYIKNIANLNYNVLNKIENKVYPKNLIKIIQFVEESIYVHCDTKQRKEFLEQNFIKNNFNIMYEWKIKI